MTSKKTLLPPKPINQMDEKEKKDLSRALGDTYHEMAQLQKRADAILERVVVLYSTSEQAWVDKHIIPGLSVALKGRFLELLIQYRRRNKHLHKKPNEVSEGKVIVEAPTQTSIHDKRKL